MPISGSRDGTRASRPAPLEGAGQGPDNLPTSMLLARCGALGGSEALEENQGLTAKVREYGAFDPIAGISTAPAPGTLAALIAAYRTDPVSTYQKLRFHVRKNHDGMLRRIVDRYGSTPLSEIKARTLLGWHAEWSAGGKLAVAHSFIGQIRTITGFGLTMMEDAECARIGMILHKLRFPAPKARTERLTADQAVAIRIMAHEFGWHSIALAQALQFELMLRQKDVIGEWVPLAEPGDSNVQVAGQKWLRGLRWDEIDDNLILRHVTSKRQKEIEVDLSHLPMVVEELALVERQASGPIVICEVTGAPYSTAEFRRKWRIVANAADIPITVRNQDTRAGAITEATDAGADLEHIRHAATHSDIAMTQKYSRGATEKTKGVHALRAAHRNRTTEAER